MLDYYCKFFVPMVPKPCQRPRFNGRYAYTPKPTQDAKAQIALFAAEARPEEWPLEGYCYVLRIKIWMRAPKDCWPGRECVTGGDLDNHAKTVMDACQEILWGNDARITNLAVTRLYARDENSQPGYDVEVLAFEMTPKPKKRLVRKTGPPE